MLGLLLLPLMFSAILGHPIVGLVPLTPEQVQRIKEWTPDDLQNIWELSGQFEGDIVLTEDDIVANTTGRNGAIEQRLRWPNNEVPYEVDAFFSANEKRAIHDAAKIFGQKSCVKVRPRRASDKDYVFVTDTMTGCNSLVGRQGGRQVLNLQRNSGCVQHGIILHEFLHAIGFWHQQSATNRDDYVTILWDNIQEGFAFAFYKYGKDLITDFGVPYDYGSIMHYDRYAFTDNGKKTIETKVPNVVIGQRDGLSEKDIKKLKLMYKCRV